VKNFVSGAKNFFGFKKSEKKDLKEDGTGNNIVEYSDQSNPVENNNDLIFQQFNINQKQHIHDSKDKEEEVADVGNANLIQFESETKQSSNTDLIDFGNTSVSSKNNPNLIDL
jgi:hypothetical protein